MYILCTSDTHYCGGTERGRSYLLKNQSIPLSFLTSLKTCK